MIIRNNDLPREDIEGYAGGQGVLEFTTLVPTELLKDEAKLFNGHPLPARRWSRRTRSRGQF